MNRNFIAIACAVSILGAAAFAAPVFGQAIQVWHAGGEVLQEIAAFDNPEGSVFGLDGRSLYISNAAVWDCEGFAFAEKAGYISKLDVNRHGYVTMAEAKFATGITAPLGMAVNQMPVGHIPAGSIWISSGAAPLGTADCQIVSDRSRHNAGVTVIDHYGRNLGFLPTGFGTAFESISGAPMLLVNALDFDSEGNLYIVDSGIGGAAFDPPVDHAAGIWKVPADSVAPLMSGINPCAPPQYISMPGGPDGVEVSPLDGTVHVNTVGAVLGFPDDAEGGMWALSAEDFAGGTLPAPFASGLGALDGLDFTDKGTRIDTEIMKSGPRNNLVVSSIALAHGRKPSAAEPSYIRLDKPIEFTGPADVDLLTLPDGSILMSVPELSVGSRGAHDQVTIIRLPANFDDAN